MVFCSAGGALGFVVVLWVVVCVCLAGVVDGGVGGVVELVLVAYWKEAS